MKTKYFMGALMPLIGMGLTTPVLAHPPAHAPAWGYYKKDHRDRDEDRYARYERYDRDGYYQRYSRYDRDRERAYAGRDYWVNRDGRAYRDYRACRDSNAEGTVVGAVTGGALGNVIAPRGSKTLGTVIGAGIGGVIGHEIDKNDNVRRC